MLRCVYPVICPWTLGSSHLSAVVNKAAINMGADIALRSCFQFFQIYTQVIVEEVEAKERKWELN